MRPSTLPISNLSVHDGELKKLNDSQWSLTFFFSAKCQYCKDLYPFFNILSQQFPNIKFDYLNIISERFLALNKKLKSPLTFIPLIILFNNGNYVATYKQDENDISNNGQKMKKFILENINKNSNTKTNKNVNPEYSLGIPGNHSHRRICKIFDNAY